MTDNILDSLPFRSVFHYYRMNIDTLTAVQAILSEKPYCALSHDEAGKIACEIIQEVKTQDINRAFIRCLPSFSDSDGNGLQETVEILFNLLEQLKSCKEKMFFLHMMYFYLHYDKTNLSEIEDVSELKEDFYQYYSVFGDKPEFTEEFLKDNIRQSLESYNSKRIRPHEFISAVYENKAADISDIIDYNIERLMCIAAAFIYRSGNSASTPEQAVAICKKFSADLVPMHEAMEEGRCYDSSFVSTITFTAIVIVGVIVGLVVESEVVISIAVIAALIAFISIISNSDTDIAEEKYQQYIKNNNTLHNYASYEYAVETLSNECDEEYDSEDEDEEYE